MNTKSRFLIPLLLPLALAAQRPWQQITVPSVREAAANFRTPPREYGAIHWAIWGGELSQANASCGSSTAGGRPASSSSTSGPREA